MATFERQHPHRRASPVVGPDGCKAAACGHYCLDAGECCVVSRPMSSSVRYSHRLRE